MVASISASKILDSVGKFLGVLDAANLKKD